MDEVIVKVIDKTVKVGYSGKKLGNTLERYGPDAADNFAKFRQHFPGTMVYDMPAVGGDNIVEVDGKSAEAIFENGADGLITRLKNNLLVLMAADCIPLVFYLPGKDLLALAHVGTSGARLHLPRKMIDKLGVPAQDLHVYVGPHVSQKSYRFPDKTKQDLDEKQLDESWRKYITEEADGIHIDLLAYVLDELKAQGVKTENIVINEVDTGADPDYFSHRRHKITGEPTGRNCFAACLL